MRYTTVTDSTVQLYFDAHQREVIYFILYDPVKMWYTDSLDI